MATSSPPKPSAGKHMTHKQRALNIWLVVFNIIIAIILAGVIIDSTPGQILQILFMWLLAVGIFNGGSWWAAGKFNLEGEIYYLLFLPMCLLFFVLAMGVSVYVAAILETLIIVF